MKPILALTIVVTRLHASLAAGPVTDGSWAPKFSACTGWVSQRPPRYALAEQGGSLRFEVDGPGSEMPWIIDLRDAGLSGDERYLLVRYRAQGMSTEPDVRAGVTRCARTR